MILLGIDTCGATGTLALARLHNGDLLSLAEAALPGRATAAQLMPALDRMLSEGAISLPQVHALVVVDGPGSFTGIRIGLSAAKALAEALSLPIFAISRLAVLAHSSGVPSAASVLDAGRGEYYYRAPTGEELLITGNELASHLGDTLGVACEPAIAAVWPQLRLVDPPTALKAIATGLPDVEAGRRADVATLDGRYLRRSDLYKPSAPSGALAATGAE